MRFLRRLFLLLPLLALLAAHLQAQPDVPPWLAGPIGGLGWPITFTSPGTHITTTPGVMVGWQVDIRRLFIQASATLGWAKVKNQFDYHGIWPKSLGLTACNLSLTAGYHVPVERLIFLKPQLTISDLIMASDDQDSLGINRSINLCYVSVGMGTLLTPYGFTDLGVGVTVSVGVPIIAEQHSAVSNPILNLSFEIPLLAYPVSRWK